MRDAFRFCWGPGAPQTVSLTLGAKGDCGHRALLSPRGHMTLGPRSPLHLLRLLVIHDPHQHGPGCGCGVPALGSGNRGNAPSGKPRFRFRMAAVSNPRGQVLAARQLCASRVRLCSQPPLGVQKKEHFLSDPGLAIQILSRPRSHIPTCCC